MKGYGYLHFTKDQIDILYVAIALVDALPDLYVAIALVDALPEEVISGTELRCHEVARYVGGKLGLEVVDGWCGPVQHSWCIVPSAKKARFPIILDPYCPGRLPAVQLIDTETSAGIYTPGLEDLKVDQAVVTKMFELKSDKWPSGSFIRVRSDNPHRPGKDAVVLDDLGDNFVELIFGCDRHNRPQDLYCHGAEIWSKSELDISTLYVNQPQ